MVDAQDPDFVDELLEYLRADADHQAQVRKEIERKHGAPAGTEASVADILSQDEDE